MHGEGRKYQNKTDPQDDSPDEWQLSLHQTQGGVDTARGVDQGTVSTLSGFKNLVMCSLHISGYQNLLLLCFINKFIVFLY